MIDDTNIVFSSNKPVLMVRLDYIPDRFIPKLDGIYKIEFPQECTLDASRYLLLKQGIVFTLYKIEQNDIKSLVSQFISDILISKTLAYILRHSSVSMDSEGYVSINDIFLRPELLSVPKHKILHCIHSDKVRWSSKIKNKDLYVRANYHHTKVVHLDKNPVKNPSDTDVVIYYANVTLVPNILKNGILKSDTRKCIHFTKNKADPRKEFLSEIYVDMRSAIEDGIIFYQTGPEVYICQQNIPAKYLHV
jgi:RNA:NAD 2'-phosphotransferase (TPT1/KptA family)